MDIKEEIHALSEEMLTNLGRLVAIDSQLGTPSEGNHLVRALQKPWKKVSRLPMSLVFKRKPGQLLWLCRNG